MRYRVKLFKRSRAVSPIISALLMIVITVSGFSLTFMMANTWISVQRLGPLLALQERLAMEDVWFMTNTTGKYICVYSRNVGKVELEIYSMMVNNVVPSGIAPAKLRLPLGFGGWMNASYDWVVGTTYKIDVLTDRGAVMTTYAAA